MVSLGGVRVIEGGPTKMETEEPKSTLAVLSSY